MVYFDLDCGVVANAFPVHVHRSGTLGLQAISFHFKVLHLWRSHMLALCTKGTENKEMSFLGGGK